MDKFGKAEAIRKKITDLQENLEWARNELKFIEDTCSHSWPKKPEYTPEYQKAYTVPGDPPGTMGVDWRGPVHVPAKTIKRWRRKCIICGKVEITERTKEIFSEEPSF